MSKQTTWNTEIFKKFPIVKENKTTEVLVVGAGLAGIWTAYLLAKAGKKVILMDKVKMGQGTSLYTTGFITQDIDTDLEELVNIYGKRTAKLAWQTGIDATEQIEAVIKAEKIDCDFMRTSLYMYAQSEDEFVDLEEEKKFAESLGFETHLIKKLDSGFKNFGALEFQNQAKYHPLKFMKGLLEACEKLGVEIFEKTEAESISVKTNIQVKLKNGFVIKAEKVEVATYEAFNNPKPIHFKKAMYTSYVYDLKIPKNSVKKGMYLDMKNPYHYVRVDALDAVFDRMIIGGEDHRAELKIAKKSYAALDRYLLETFPNIKYELVSKWDGAILESSDGLPLIGEYAPSQYVLTAFSGSGMTYSATGARIICDQILGKRNKYTSMYDPKRALSVKALYEKAKDYGEEFVKGALKNILK